MYQRADAVWKSTAEPTNGAGREPDMVGDTLDLVTIRTEIKWIYSVFAGQVDELNFLFRGDKHIRICQV